MAQAEQQQVIVPPPDIKTIIDKLAKRVASQPEAQATQFVTLILKNDPNNAKFNFLKHDDDPYRPYYQRRLAEERGEVETAVEQTPLQANQVKEMPKKPENEFQQLLREEIFGRQQQAEIKPPPPDQFQAPQVSMSQLELDTLKLTAQFVARNQNKHFLQKLTQQEARNPRFDFLKPTHPSFTFFTAMVEQYSRVMLPRSEMLQRYRNFAESQMNVLKAGGQRQMYDEWRVQNARAAKEGDDDGSESDVSSLDWEQFVVVEQIDLYDDVTMETQVNDEDRQTAIQKQNNIQIAILENKELESMPDPHAVPQSALALDPNLKLKPNFVRKAAVQEESKLQMQKCPNCKQDISKSEWRDHFKICVLDSKWKDQKQQRLDRQGGMNQLASGEEINQNLKRFAMQRPDLAGNAADLQYPEQQTTSSAVIWDGQSQNITRTTANIAMLRAQQQKNLQEVLSQRGLLDQRDLNYLKHQEETPLQSTLLQKDFVAQPVSQTPVVSEEDKALALLQGHLRSEADWLRLYGRLTLTLAPDNFAISRLPVQCQKPQVIEADCRMKVAELKQLLSHQLQAGIPSNLLVIRGTPKNVALKDTLTLAFFNIPDQVTLTYSITR